MAMKSELVGLKAANRALRKLPKFARVQAQVTMDETAFEVAHLASAKAPRGPTGLLAESIDWLSRKQAVQAVVVMRNITKTYYWRFVEYGTKFIDAQPFLRPAAETVRPDHKKRLEANLMETLSEVEADARSGGDQ